MMWLTLQPCFGQQVTCEKLWIPGTKTILFLFLICGQHRDFTCLLQGGYTESIKIKLRKKLQISIHVSICECKGGSMIFYLPPWKRITILLQVKYLTILHNLIFFSKDSGFIIMMQQIATKSAQDRCVQIYYKPLCIQCVELWYSCTDTHTN